MKNLKTSLAMTAVEIEYIGPSTTLEYLKIATIEVDWRASITKLTYLIGSCTPKIDTDCCFSFMLRVAFLSFVFLVFNKIVTTVMFSMVSRYLTRLIGIYKQSNLLLFLIYLFISRRRTHCVSSCTVILRVVAQRFGDLKWCRWCQS